MVLTFASTEKLASIRDLSTTSPPYLQKSESIVVILTTCQTETDIKIHHTSSLYKIMVQ